MATTIKLEVQAAVKDALKDIENFSRKTQKSVSVIESAFIGAGVVAAGFVAAFSFDKIIRGISSVVDAASAQEDAINQLNTALRISGEYTAQTSAELVSYAESLQATTKFSDDAIISAQSLIQAIAQLDKDGLKGATKATLDFAAAMGIDLDSAARLVGKAAEGNVEAFSRYGVEIRKGANDAQTFANTLEALNSKFGGSAAAQVNTYSGAVSLAINAFDDLKESLGEAITGNSAVIAGVKGAAAIFNQLASIVKQNKVVMQRFVKDAIILLLKAIPTAIAVLRELNDTFLAVRTVVSGTSKFFTRVTAAMMTMGEEDQDLVDQIQKNAKKEVEAIESSQGAAEDAYLERSKLIDGLIESARAGVDSTIEQINSQKDLASAVQNSTAKQVKAYEELTDAQKKQKAEQVKGIAESPGAALFSGGKSAGAPDLSGFETTIAVVIGSMNQAVKGAEGAAKLVSGIIGKVAESFLPGIGAAVESMVSEMQKGPDHVRAQVKAFTDAIPMTLNAILMGIEPLVDGILKNIGPMVTAILSNIGNILADLVLGLLDSIFDFIVELPEILINIFLSIGEQLPLLIDRLIAELPRVIDSFASNMVVVAQRLAEQAPEIMTKLALEAPRLVSALISNLGPLLQSLIGQIPTIVLAFSSEFIKNAPTIAIEFAKSFIAQIPEIIASIAKGVYEAIKGVFGGIGDAVSAIGDAIGLARGGVIPGGFPNDSFPARLTSGEMVIDRSDNERLGQFLGAQPEINQALFSRLDAIADKIASGGSDTGRAVTVNLQIGESELASVLLNLSRQGFRTA